MKSVRAAELLGIAASWLGAAPPPAQALFWWGIPLVPLPAPLLNLICTNVPGSPTPLYSVGKRMLASYPHVPTGYELGVGIAVQSYDGKMCFGLTADADRGRGRRRLRDFIRTSWEELCRAAGIRPGPHRDADRTRRSRSGNRRTPKLARRSRLRRSLPPEPVDRRNAAEPPNPWPMRT